MNALITLYLLNKKAFFRILLYSAFLVAAGCLNIQLVWTQALAEPSLQKAYQLYAEGNYKSTIETLNSLELENKGALTKELKSTLFYLKGLSFSRLQNLDQAKVYLNSAIKAGFTGKEIYYELGQILYALQELKPAIQAFEKSIQTNYKMGASLYYKGYIYQTLEDHKTAQAAYEQILQMKTDLEGVKQAALFQKAEIKLIQMTALKNKQSEKLVASQSLIPSYQKVIDFEPSNALASQSQIRIGDLYKKYDLSPPRKNWKLGFNSDTSYDSNVVAESDSAITKVSKRASIIQKLALSGGLDFNPADTWTLTTDLATDFKWHGERTAPSVFSNDQASGTLGIRSSAAHKITKNISGDFISDLEYNAVFRDYKSEHRFPYYSRYYNLTIGERVHFFSFGPTLFKVNFKLVGSYDANLNGTDPGFSFSQGVSLTDRLSAQVSLSGDWLKQKNPTTDKTTYRFSPNLTYSQIQIPLLGSWSSTAALDFSLADPVHQRATRGYTAEKFEQTWAPSLSLTRTLARSLSLTLSYAYTKNLSKDSNTYAYIKHLTSMGLSFGL